MTKILKCLFVSISFIFCFHQSYCTNYYWVGGTGNWSDYAAHWATTSGGVVFHIQPPTPSDNVFFDGNSFTTTGDTVYLDSTIINCNTMDWSNVSNNPVFSGASTSNNSLSIYGSLILNPSMKWNLNGILNLNSSQTGNSINTAGVPLSDSLTYTTIFVNDTGSWYLLNDITVNALLFYNGTFFSNNHIINADLESRSLNVHLYLGTSDIYGSFYGNENTDADSVTIYGNVTGNNMSVYRVLNSNIVSTLNSSFKYVECSSVSGSYNFFETAIFPNDSCSFSFSNPCNYIFGNSNTFKMAFVPCSFFYINGNQSFDTLILNRPGQIVQLNNNNIHINNLLEINSSCTAPVSIISLYDTSTITFSAGNYVFANLFLKNIETTGATSCMLNNSIDGGGNIGWTINPPIPRSLYWVGGSGAWNDSSHWSISSGGAAGVCIPNLYDSVFFDSNSFLTTGDTVFATADFMYCKNMDWSSAINNPVFYNAGSFTNQLYISGSIILNPIMNWRFHAIVHLNSPSAGNIVSTFGITTPVYLQLEGGGGWELQSNFSNGSISFLSCVFRSNNFSMHGSFSTEYNLSNNVSVLFGTSFVSGSVGFIDGSNITIDADSAHFNLTGLSALPGMVFNDVIANNIQASSCSFHDVQTSSIYGNNNIFHNVVFNSDGNISGTNNIIHKATVTGSYFYFGWIHAASFTFDSLLFNTPGIAINFADSSMLIINNYLSADGSCGGLTTLNCNLGNAIIKKTSGNVTLNYVLLKNISAIGGAVFNATNAIDDGGNSGWNISQVPPANLYWVGGSGNWNDVNHWSYSSGGVGGACIPTKVNDVIFDSNSFLQTGDTVFDLNSNASVHSMVWDNVTHNPVYYKYIGTLNVFGSLILDSAMSVWFDGMSIRFMSDNTGNIFNTNGQKIYNLSTPLRIYFQGNGSWDLANDLDASWLYFINGTFRSNNYAISAGAINPYNFEMTPAILLGTSLVTASQVYFQGNYLVDADSSSISSIDFMSSGTARSFKEIFSSQNAICDSCQINFLQTQNFLGKENVVHSILFTNGNVAINGINNYFQKLIASGNVFISGSTSFDTLVMNNPGQQVELSGTITVNDILQIQSSAAFPTSITAYQNATIIKPTDTVCTDFVYLKNISATGGAAFFAGDNSVDLGNNSGWNFWSCTPAESNVWPGDANYDLITDNFDLLNIGIAYNDTGFVRSGATLNYIAQPCTDWQHQFANGANLKHADTDGNGTVNADDTLAISINYGLTHPLRPSSYNSQNTIGADLFFQMPSSVLSTGDTVDIPILLGTPTWQAHNVYGFAFTINYDAAFVQQGTMRIDYNNSWIAGTGNYIKIEKDFYNIGKLDVAFSRINQTDVSGDGIIATLHFVVGNVTGQMLNLSFSKIKIISHYEIELPVNYINGSVLTGIEDNNSDIDFFIAPNPAKDELRIRSDESGIKMIEVFDALNNVMLVESTAAKEKSIKINVGNFAKGVYFVKAFSDKGIAVKKFVKE